MRGHGNERILKNIQEMEVEDHLKHSFLEIFREEFANSPGHYKDFYRGLIKKGSEEWGKEDED